MTRVKRGTTARKRRKALLKETKGYRWGRKSKKKQAKQAVIRARQHSFAHRKDKKGVFRRLWQTRINAAVRAHGLSYSVFMNLLKQDNIGLDRKILADLAENESETFTRIVEKVKK